MAALLLLGAVEHHEHSLGNEEAAENVNGGEDSSADTENDGSGAKAGASLLVVDGQHGTDDDDATDGVGDSHQRSVQSGCDRPHHVIADDNSEDESQELTVEVGHVGISTNKGENNCTGSDGWELEAITSHGATRRESDHTRKLVNENGLNWQRRRRPEATGRSG